MRNILAYVPQTDKEKVSAKLKLIWKAPDDKSAGAMKNDFCDEYEKSFPKAVECLEEGFEDSVQFYAFEELDSRKISSTNTLERLNWEIRRRSSVVGIDKRSMMDLWLFSETKMRTKFDTIKFYKLK